MKKTLVALAVMVAAGSAQAIELYNQDGVSVDLSGDVEVRYIKKTDENANTTQQIDDADFGFDTRYQINDEYQIGAFFEFSGDNNDRATGNSSVGNVYVALYTQTYGDLKVGKLDTIIDDAGVGSDFAFGVKSFFDDAPTGGEEAVRYDYDNGAFYLGLGLIQDKYNTDDKRIGKDGNYLDAKVGYRINDLDLTAYYATADLRGKKKNDAGTQDVLNTDATIFAFEAVYAGIENLNLELGYYSTDEEHLGTVVTREETDTVALAADYTWNEITFAAGYSTTDFEASDAKDANHWFGNVAYSVAPNTKLYAEVGGNNADKSETGYAVGIQAKF
ncbi:porin [Vibrio sonorensis]|uniref:porin n=1 Tax=Vibrio sonorensis TaxID=1004316 RepID=UPI0008D92236|nr:porin [Vibrio sonorensis]